MHQHFVFAEVLDILREIWYFYIAMKDKFDINDFMIVYKGTTNFCESAYFKAFYESLSYEELYKHLIFCNDVLEIPPIEAFVKYRQKQGDKLFCEPMSKTDKRCLGACFGYLFKNLLGYKAAVSKWVGEPLTQIRNASYFIKE